VKRKQLWGMLLVVVLMYMTIGGINIRTPSGVELPVMKVAPSTKEVLIGTYFTLDMNISGVTVENSGDGIYGWEFDISFNASILQVDEVMEGPFLSDVDSTSWEMGYTLPKIDNTAGTVVASNTLWLYPAQGAFGSGVLYNVTFLAIDEGVTTIHIYKTSLNTFDGTDVLPVSHTKADGSVTVTAGHDVAVVSITAPDEAPKASSVPIDVIIKNEGSYDETVTLTAKNETTVIGTHVFALNKGTETTRSFSWSTTGVSKGTYTLSATATITVDNDPTDNSKTRQIRIVEHDVAVTSIGAPNKAKAGSTVPMNATVQNQGSNDETVTLKFYKDASVLDTQVFGLTKGTSTTRSYNWNTAGLEAGRYTLKATATISVDDDPSDDTKTRLIELELLRDVAVIDIEAPVEALVGTTILINVTVTNQGDFTEDPTNVKITRDTTYIDDENLALAPGETKVAHLTWDTTGLPVATYYIKANATIAPKNKTDTWTGDGVTKIFYTTRKPIKTGSEKVYVNDVLKTKDLDYTITYSTGVITFILAAPGSGANIRAEYQFVDKDTGNNHKTAIIILKVHDVNVAVVAPSWGFNDYSIYVNVTVTNQGSFRETVNLVLKYDTTLLLNETFDVVIGTYRLVAFIWNITGVPKGTYTLTATATVLESIYNPTGDDYEPGDNTATDSIKISQWVPGDGDFNGLVEMPDFYVWREWFGKHEGEWPFTVNPNYETINSVDYVDMYDFYEWRAHWGQTPP